MFTTVFLLSGLLLPILRLPLVSAVPKPELHERDDHDHSSKRQLPGSWFHPRDHPVRSLFRRQADDGLPDVGSAEWSAKWPTGDPSANIPQEWTDALNAAVAAGKIPDIPVAATGPVYPQGEDPTGAEICSGTFGCKAPEDIWDAPDGYIGLSVDDGPVSVDGASNTLYDFLKANNAHVTHFMIGSNIRDNSQVFLRAFNELEDDIGCHTWTHPYMTTQTNTQVLAELGWTLQIIHDSTGGRVPRYWRPPYGDVDNRVRAIATEVFGLTAVIWNQDTDDWSMATGATTLDAIQAEWQQWLDGPKSPGLIVLEHEIAAADVTAFQNAFALYSNRSDWKVASVAQLFPDQSWYLNSADNTSPVVSADILNAANGGSSSTTSSTSTSISTGTGTASTTTVTRGSQDNTGKNSAVSTRSGLVGLVAGFICVGGLLVL